MSFAGVLALAGVVALLLALHPFTTYPLSLWWLARSRPATLAPAGQGRALSCTVCMCAYNEEHVIGRKIDNLLALKEREPELELMVYVDAASDRTTEILRGYADRIDLHVSSERHGKTHGMNLLAQRARTDLLLFTDANVLLDMECVSDFRRHFADPRIGCVTGNLVYTNAGDSVAAASGSLYWRFEEALKRLEGRTGSVIGADGSVFAVRRALHRPPPDDIIDDLFVSLQVLIQGHRVIQAADARGYEESVASSNEEFRRKIRIACQAFNVHRLLWPQLRALDALSLYKYVSHKLIRWLTIYLVGAACALFAAAGLLAGYATTVGLASLCLLAAGWLGSRGVRPFAQLFEILAAFAGTGIGIWRSLMGERFQTWSPAASIRKPALPG